MSFRAPEGTKDILPPQAEIGDAAERWRNTGAWQRLEAAARACFARFGYEEIRTPAFEFAALFRKSSGETTDIVEKEMFTFEERGENPETFALRPELTPGAIRAVLNENLLSKRSLWKLWYMGPAFRGERPQRGRYRQFTQLGVEAVGSPDPLVDVETMVLFAEILKAVGVSSWELRINSLGCGECRGGYRDALKALVQPRLAGYCEDCRRRLDRNVFRILDCKKPACSALAAQLPSALDHACAKCGAHMAAVESGLKGAEVPYRVDPRIVRGLDYYTRTVYEVSSSALGSQNALGGGGRYDTLVRDMGGPDVGSVGFAAGMERILLAMEPEAGASALDFFGVSITPELRGAMFQVVTRLRRAGLSGDMDLEGRSVKAQFRQANKSGAKFALVLGPDEAAQGKIKLKDMAKEGAERAVTPEEAAALIREGGKS